MHVHDNIIMALTVFTYAHTHTNIHTPHTYAHSHALAHTRKPTHTKAPLDELPVAMHKQDIGHEVTIFN